jgi:hypothetical protein
VLKGPATHVVKPGEWLGSIAVLYGFGDPDKIWQHANNSSLRERRADPRQLVAGDSLFIPAPEPAELRCATGRRHRLQANVPAADVNVELLDAQRRPIEDQRFSLTFGGIDGAERTLLGTTSGGTVEASLPASCASAILELHEMGARYELLLGHLDPVDDEDVVTGAQARLNNLGFGSGAVDGDAGPTTTEAVRAFQSKVMGRKNADGALDAETRQRLADEHGS